MWDAYRCHTSAAVRAETARLRLHTAIVPEGCTKFIQAADVVWNACFKSNLRSLYDAWIADPAGHQYTKGGNLKPPSRTLLCQWVKSSWEAVPDQMVKDSFTACAITTSTDGSDDNHIHCFKAGQPCAAGKSRLEEETKKLQDSGSAASLIEDPFASDEDSDEADNNEACIYRDDHKEEEGDKEENEEEDDEEGSDEEEDEEETDVEEDDKEDDEEKDDKEEDDDCHEGKADHQLGGSEDLQEDKAGDETGVGQLPISKRRKEGNQAAKELMQVQRLRKVTKDINKGAPIDVDEMQPLKPAEMWIRELGLFKVDQECLLSRSGWLTDSIINAAQKLLQMAYATSGFQSVTHGLTMTFDVTAGEFVQILHTGIGHWVTVSTIGMVHPTVRVYDSLYTSASTTLQSQIACILATKEAEITLNFMDVPMQSGASDCWVYAIAFTTALAQGKHPECYVFSQHKMRAHLRRCLIGGRMEMFPYTEVHMHDAGKVRAVQKVPIYCLCRMPEQPGVKMLACSSCNKCFHSACEALPAAAATHQNWLCSRCT